MTQDAHPPASPDANTAFRMDALHESLVSGRLSGRAFDEASASLLLALLERLNWPVRPREIAQALPHFPDRFALPEIRATLARLGFASREHTVPGHRLRHLQPASIILDRNDNLKMVSEDGKLVGFSARGTREQDLVSHSISHRHAYRAVQFEPSLRGTDTSLVTASRVSWTSELFQRFAPELRLILALTILSGCLAILVAFGITTIFDTVVPTRNKFTLFGILAGLGLVLAFDLAFRRIKALCVGRISGRIEYILGSGLFDKLLKLPAPMIASASVTDQMSRLRQFEAIRDLVGGPVALVMLELPMTLVLLATVALLAWPLALTLVVYIAVFSVLAILLTPGIRREARKLSAAQNALNRLSVEILAQRRQIARFGVAHAWNERVARAVRDLTRQRRRHASFTRSLEGLAHISLPLAASTVIGAGALLVIGQAMTGGELVAVTILTWRMFAPVQQGLLLISKLQDVVTLTKQVDALMQIPEEDTPDVEDAPKLTVANITASGVVFRHPKSVTPTLLGVTLDIPHGAFVAVTGKAGSGKSTLLQVLAGLQAPQAGLVRLNSLNLAQLSQEYRAENIAYVAQQPLYFFGTVAQNLRFADPGASDDSLLNTLDELGLSPWLAQLPDGLNTGLDPSKDRALLTPSVRNCIAIAQAFLRDPAILLLDEPAGGMDRDLEAHLLQALDRRKDRMTRVMVTYRPSIINRADSVIEIAHGRVAMTDTGTPSQVAS